MIRSPLLALHMTRLAYALAPLFGRLSKWADRMRVACNEMGSRWGGRRAAWARRETIDCIDFTRPWDKR